MKFQNIVYASLFVCASFTFSSCVDLEEEPESIISPANFYKSEADFDAAINGAIKPIFGSYGAFDFNNAILLGGGLMT